MLRRAAEVLANLDVWPRPAHRRWSRDGVRPFVVNVPQTTLDDLQARLGRTRWPDEVEGAGWDYGASLAYLRDVAEYWRTRFDWRAEGAR